MLIAPLPETEPERLAALYRYNVLDSSPEETFDRVIALATRVFKMPIALISLVDSNRQWFKAIYGWDVNETGRDISFCSHTILSDSTMVINDTALDSRFIDNPLVTNAPYIRFYAGTSLRTHDGYNIGTLCVMDRQPHEFSMQEKQNLEDLAKLVIEQLELRLLTTRLVQAETAMETALAKENELNDLKSRFISMTSHEFRTPLSAILSSAELLDSYRTYWADDKVTKYLHQIQKAVGQISDLLSDMLTLSESEAGKLEFKPALLNLYQFCRNLTAEHFDGEAAARINFVYNCPKMAVYNLDERLLHQIISNLLTNALKYSPSHKQVDFEVACQAGKIVINVQDAGIGIPAHDQTHLFELFHRATNVGTIHGTGLGLAIVKKSVEAHGGSITFNSQEGSGTTFSVILPVANTH